MLRARVPEAEAALAAVRRRIGGRGSGPSAALESRPAAMPQGSSHRGPVTYPEQRNSSPPGGPALQEAVQEPIRRRPPEQAAKARIAKGPEVTDRPLESAASGAGSGVGSSGVPPRPVADDFQPDIPPEPQARSVSAHARPSSATAVLPADDPPVGPIPFDAPRERGPEPSVPQDDVQLVPGARIAGGRYRLLVFHGGAPPLQFWQALDTALDRQVALTFVDPDGALPEDVAAGDPGPHAAAQPDRQARHRPGARRRPHRFRRPGGRGVDPRRFAAGGGRHLAVARRRRPGHAVAGRGRRRRPPRRRRAVDRPPQPGAGQHRRRRRAGLPGDHARRQPARTTSAESAPRCMPCWSTGGRCRSPGCAAGSRRPSGTRAGHPVEPTAIDRDIPFQISAVAVRAVQEDGGIRSASTLLNLLQQATAVADRTEVLGPIDDSPPPPVTSLRAGRELRDPRCGGAAT